MTEFAIILIVGAVLFFAFFVWSMERKKKKGKPKKPKKQRVKKEKAPKEQKNRRQQRVDTDEVPNFESLQVMSDENLADNAQTSSTPDLHTGSNDFLQQKMDQLFNKYSPSKSGERQQAHNPFQSPYSSDAQAGGYTSVQDASSGERKRRSIRSIDIHKGISHSVSPGSIGEEFGYSINDFSGRSESEIANAFRDLSPEIRAMIVANILNRLYD